MKIIFMGTPEFAVPVLEALHKEHEIVAVYTQAPKPAGRGQKETFSPVHNKALELSLSIYNPKTLRNETAKAEFLSLKADCAIVMAYGLILPKEILNHCKFGAINLHPSSLPLFRGAAPMQRTIMSGELKTAMCIMKMDEGIDTGDILMQQEVTLDEEITYVELSNLMSKLGAELILEVLNNIEHINPTPQVGDFSYAHKITKEEGLLTWNERAIDLTRKVRALNPWPGTYFMLNEEKIKILSAKFSQENHQVKSGTIIDKKNFRIACQEGVFEPTIIQRPGKKALTTKEFLNGFNLPSEL